LQDASQRQLAISGYIFKIVHNRASGSLQLQVNFDRQIIALFKEVRNFVWLNLQVPHAISNVSKEAKRVYPHAVSLVETIRTYTQTLRKIEDMSSVSTLLSGFRMEVQNLISKGMQLKWESFVHSFDPHHRTGSYLANGNTDGSVHPPLRESRHIQFVRDFAMSTSTLQTKTDTLISIYDDVLQCLNELKTCQYSSVAFADTVHRVQDLVVLFVRWLMS
jgi:dynein heavy chain 1, cytosolic